MSEAEETPDAKTPIEQAVEHAFDLFVYAPIGILFEGSSLLPDLIQKGKNHVATARFMGKFAVEQASTAAAGAAAKAQDQAAGVISFLGESISPLQPDAEPETAPEPPPPPPRPAPRAAAAKVASTAASAVSSAIDATSLAIPDYDGLSASQVVNRLAGLAPVELENVQLYEAAHRGRKTILSKVAQLQGR